jgi:hypothetical protein
VAAVPKIKEVADRIDGKVPIQQVVTGDEDGGPVPYFAEVRRSRSELIRGKSSQTIRSAALAPHRP